MLFFEITDLHRLLGHPSSKNDLEWDALTENDQFILEIKNLSIGLPKTADRAFAITVSAGIQNSMRMDGS